MHPYCCCSLGSPSNCLPLFLCRCCFPLTATSPTRSLMKADDARPSVLAFLNLLTLLVSVHFLRNPIKQFYTSRILSCKLLIIHPFYSLYSALSYSTFHSYFFSPPFSTLSFSFPCVLPSLPSITVDALMREKPASPCQLSVHHLPRHLDQHVERTGQRSDSVMTKSTSITHPRRRLVP